MDVWDSDFVVVGSGVAGLTTALHLARAGRVLVVTKKDRAESNTNYAQGGIACVVGRGDTREQHVRDTLEAGAGLCDPAVVTEVVDRGPEAIAELERCGVTFERRRDGGAAGYDLGREGGHSRRRVLHVGDVTGQAIERALLRRAGAHPNLEFREHWMLIDLVCTGWLGLPGPNRCVGAYVLNRKSGQIAAFRTAHTVLATGGGGKVYLYTSNPDIATGDGVAIAWRAGVPIRNMEFIQFHPTCFYHPRAKSFLISEAVRGEGAVLSNRAGERFMDRDDGRGSLAPRDIVARAIDAEMKRTGAPCVYLDITHRTRAFLKRRFPTIYETCLSFGVDMAVDPIPVVPAAHYFCGGIAAGLDGVTAVPGLYACGEVACTGLHGANRLASNSLLEAVVGAGKLGDALVARGPDPATGAARIPDWEYGDAVSSDEEIVVEHNWNEVRACMWDYVGIVRSDKRLERAARRIRNLRHEIREYYLRYLVTPDILELRNIADVAELIVRSARERRESRGLHYTLDCPERRDDRFGRDTVIRDEPGARA